MVSLLPHFDLRSQNLSAMSTRSVIDAALSPFVIAERESDLGTVRLPPAISY
jgi:hypothetical protein